MGLLGAHVSISGGVEKAPFRGKDFGCDSIQIFSKNQRQWKAASISNESVSAFQNAVQDLNIQKVVIHDSYLINLASPDPEGLLKSRNAFIDEMIRADQLSVPYLVFHPGSHINTGEEKGIQQIAESLNFVLDEQPKGRVVLLLETTAGQGSNLGYRFEQIAEIIDSISEKGRIGVCYDIAHAFAAGYDIRTEKEYEETIIHFDAVIGLDKLKVFHLNDSKSSLGSRVDRHENIGKGMIGLETFGFLVNDSRFSHHPMILETPKGEKYYKENLKILKSLIN